jgi:hypothetical protein
VYNAITESIPKFPEVHLRMEGPAVNWDDLSVNDIIAVLHTFKGYVPDMLGKQINELTYVQTMWILGGFCNHYASKGLDFISALTQKLLDSHLVRSRTRTCAHHQAQLRNELRHQFVWCPDYSDMRVVDPTKLNV